MNITNNIKRYSWIIALVMSISLILAGGATSTTMAANPAANIDQCANDPAPSPNTDGCNSDPRSWVNGNLGASKSVYVEGDTIPYRLRFSNLSLASHTVVIEWDTTKASMHAIDYLTTFNQSVLDANPCLGVTGCSAFNPYTIPADPQVTGAGVTPIPGDFRLYGGTITGVSAYSYPVGSGFDGDKSAQITITFTASVANPVLAWGGHIATRADWPGASAVFIPGSPYHSRLISLDGTGGNQDRSLSAEAVIFPASITIIKDAIPNGSTSFGFTASPAPLADFSLVDDGVAANYTKLFEGITTFTTYNVAETVPTNWSLADPVCTTDGGGDQDINNPGVAIHLVEGENVICTFTNTLLTGSLQILKTVSNPDGATLPASFSVDYNCGVGYTGNVSVAPGSPATVNNIPVGNTCSVTEVAPDPISGFSWGTISYTPTSVVISTAGQTFDITVGNSITRDLGNFKITKSTSNPNGATLPAAFTGTYDCGTGYTGVFSVADGASQTISGIPTGNTCSVVETAPVPITGYTWGTITYTPASIVISTKGGTFEIVVGNSITRDRGSLVLAKTLTGGPLGFTGPFTIHYDCGVGFIGDVSVSVGGSATVSNIPTLTSCIVSEPTLPIAPGGYHFGTPSFSPSATVIIPAGNGSSVTVTTNNTLIPNTGMLLPTQTTCEMYRDGTYPAPYSAFTYGVKGGVINSISPGVIFYYNTVTVQATGDLTIVQINTLGWDPMLVHSSLDQAKLFDEECNPTQFTAEYGLTDNVVVFNDVAPDTYIIGIKYSPANLVGQPVSSPYPTSIYSWDTVGYPGSLASIPVQPR